jgi:glyoxylate reductase
VSVLSVDARGGFRVKDPSIKRGRRGACEKKPLVVVTRSCRLSKCASSSKRAQRYDRPFSQAELVEAVKTADVVVPTVTDRIDSAVLSQAGENLKLIANFGNGVDNIDVVTANNRGINVTNTPGVLTEDTADMTMALMLAVPRRLAEGIKVMEHGTGPAGRRPGCSGHRIWGKRLGIIGMGRIGQAVARRAKAFGMSIHYHNRRRVPAAWKKSSRRPIGTVSTRCWRAWTWCRCIARTRRHLPLLSARRLKLMKPDAYLVNTARGEVIDEAA